MHTDLRVSLTDRCNLRCTYCMPAESLAWLPRDEILADDEVVRLVRIAIERLGITKVRLTGGEPLLRRGLPDLVARLADLDPGLDLSLTTNGVGLARTATALREAGLRRVNVSLDTLRPERYAEITRRDRLSDVLDGLRAARAAGLGCGPGPGEGQRRAGARGQRPGRAVADRRHRLRGRRDRERDARVLRALLRGGANDATIEGAWRTSIAGKGAGHAINDPGFRQPERPMSAIGG